MTSKLIQFNSHGQHFSTVCCDQIGTEVSSSSSRGKMKYRIFSGNEIYLEKIAPVAYSGSNNCPNVCMFFTKVDNP